MKTSDFDVPYRLDGHNALVTGAGRLNGIAAAIARELARGGANIFITWFHPYDAAQPWDSQPEEPEVLLNELVSLGVQAGGCQFDLSDPESIPRLFDLAENTLGPISILVNDAVVSENGGWEILDSGQFDRHYAVNLRAAGLSCAEFARRCPPGGGRIINLSSGQGLGPMPDELAYAATKGGLEALTVSLSPALARKGITVNAVDPGATDSGWIPPELRASLMATSPFGRIGQPQDAAYLVRFLASPAAGWITGQIIHSRGGL